ncbi:hypothetical protein [Clostridium sp.]|jgi:hypothetical protein|uniref:hypothetical protein n=1 Tax=Clostridium sp. TaxID=1506 RepID=UPI003EF02BF9
MKKNKYIGFSMVSMILIFVGCSNVKTVTSVDTSTKEKIVLNSLGTTGSTGGFKELKINASIDKDKLPKSVKVYNVKKPNLNNSKIKEMALKLGVKGEIRERDQDIAIKGKNASFYVNKNTGSSKYFTKEYIDGVTNPLKKLLSDSEYIKLAKDFAQQYDIAKPNMVCKGVNRGYTLEREDANGIETIEIFRVEVKFESPRINNIVYTGVGPKISVWFGEDGKIIGYASLWRELEEVKEVTDYPSLSIDQVIKNVKDNKKSLVYNMDEPDDEGTINSVETVLWSDPEGFVQEQVVPYYMLKGRNKNGKKFTIITRAISDEYIKEKEVASTK